MTDFLDHLPKIRLHRKRELPRLTTEERIEAYLALRLGDKVDTNSRHDNVFHVRGFVDGRVILWTWSPGRQRWDYLIVVSGGFEVGLYTPRRPRRLTEPEKCRRRHWPNNPHVPRREER